MTASVISPKGRFMQITEAVPVCEKLVKFNGKRRLLMERAEKPATATAVALCIAQERNTPFANMSQELLVGNLPAGKTEEILRSLLTQGYFDFTELSPYQEAKDISKISLDQGKSQPYTTEDMPGSGVLGTFCSNNFLGGVPLSVSAINIDNCYGWGCAPVPEAEDQDVDMWDEEGLEEEEDLDE